MKNNEMKSLLNEISEKYGEIIRDKLIRIILFGSYARGHKEEYSDFDIMILVDDSDENIKKFDRLLEDINHELTMKYEVIVSYVMIRFELFKEYKDILPFYMNWQKRGSLFIKKQLLNLSSPIWKQLICS